MTEVYYSAAADLIYLVACAVNRKTPDVRRVEKMNLDAVYELAAGHSLSSVTAFALEAAGVKDSRFAEAKAKTMRKLVLLEMERKRVLQQLDARGVWYLPLKGAVLKDDYPAFGMREMADNDILCDPDRMADVKTVMESLGFTCESYRKYHHDTYSKPPSIEFEMHRQLLDVHSIEALGAYYADIRDRLLKDEGNRCGYHLSDEDFYIFLLAHEHKHYSHAGTGLRSLLDVYVFLNAKGEGLDRDYLAAELDKAGLTGFERLNRELAQRVFTDGDVDEKVLEELSYFLTSGTYGNEQRQEYNSLNLALKGDDSSAAKARHIRRRIFLTDEVLQKQYPFFAKHKIFLPFLFIFRVFRGIFVHPQTIVSELKFIKNFKTKK